MRGGRGAFGEIYVQIWNKGTYFRGTENISAYYSLKCTDGLLSQDWLKKCNSSV